MKKNQKNNISHGIWRDRDTGYSTTNHGKIY